MSSARPPASGPTDDRTPEEIAEARAAEVDFLEDVDDAMPEFDVRPVSAPPFPEETSVRDLRRARQRSIDSPITRMSLVEDADGILRWTLGAGPAPARPRPGGRRGSGRGSGPGLGRGPSADRARILRQFKFRDLPPNLVGARLRALDDRLNPHLGLKEVSPRSGNVLVRDETPAADGRILLLVHGTFSRVEHMLDEIRATDAGRDWLDECLAGPRYRQVLAFNHPTLSTSPILNAARLADAFRGSNATVDVVAHSRGCLVTRWWREWLAADPGIGGVPPAPPPGLAPARTIAVGGPLGGTSLAAPRQLKHALDLLANYARAMRTAARIGGAVVPAAAPFASAAGVLFGLLGRVMSVAARTPALDAGVSMIPGLAGQSREGANDGILALRGRMDGLDRSARRAALESVHAVTSNFEPEDVGWRFWRAFRGVRGRLADTAADIVFPGPNDLVVDTPSMIEFGDDVHLEPPQVLDFGTSRLVHHTNYFQQPETIALLRRVLLESAP